MIIAAFTYGLLEGDLFRKLVGKEFHNAEEMIRKINRFLRQEAESTEKAKMEGKTTGTTNKKFVPMGAGRNNQLGNQHKFGRYPQPGFRGRGRPNGRFTPYRQEAYDVGIMKGSGRGSGIERKKFSRDPNQYCDLHKRMGHATNEYEGFKKDKEKKKAEAEPEKRKEKVVYEAEVLMIQASHLPAKKRRRSNIEFSIDDPVPKNHVGTEPLVI